ncbi:NmrA-like protein [Alternaria alternata]|nr:NmrA-like protein [Alternaria alternata]
MQGAIVKPCSASSWGTCAGCHWQLSKRKASKCTADRPKTMACEGSYGCMPHLACLATRISVEINRTVIDIRSIMPSNRIAIYGHRGLFSSQIVSALIASDASITILYRPGSDTCNLPASVTRIEVDVLDQDALVAALQDIDIVMLCAYSTVGYVAAAYVSIFTTTPVAEISNRAIGLVELAPTGAEIAAALEEKHGKEPKIFRQSIEKVEEDFSHRLDSDLSALTPAWYYRKLWGTGELTSLLGSDIWDVPRYKKATLEDLVVNGKVGHYRDLSRVLPYLEEAMFQ